MTAVAVKTFDIDWTLNIVSVVTGVPPSRRVLPKPWAHSTSSPSTTAMERPGIPCSAMSSGIRCW
jgi:hypothetical protein